MALKKHTEIEGESFIRAASVVINTGKKKTSFLSTCKIVSISGDKNLLHFAVQFAGDEISFVEQYSFTPSVEDGAPNFIKQAYLYLKTLSEFEGAEDC